MQFPENSIIKLRFKLKSLVTHLNESQRFTDFTGKEVLANGVYADIWKNFVLVVKFDAPPADLLLKPLVVVFDKFQE